MNEQLFCFESFAQIVFKSMQKWVNNSTKKRENKGVQQGSHAMTGQPHSAYNGEANGVERKVGTLFDLYIYDPMSGSLCLKVAF